tara:strand:+ start:753 stop:1790 length:1038 start_codon:yes stop_codon:yes gene_type:complete
MPYIGNTSPSRFVSNRAASVYSGDGSTTAFTLEQAVAQDEDVLVSVDGVIQEPSVAYAVSNGTTLTFTAAPSSNSGNNIFVYYLASQVGTVGHPSNQALSATSGTFTGNVTAPSGTFTTTSTSTSAFSFANQLNNSSASNDSIVALGFHNRADANADGVGAAIALSGSGVAAGSGNLIFCIKDTSGIANTVAPSDVKMTIDSTGAVTMPSQPAFFVRASAQNNIANSTTLTLDNEVFDQNADFASNTFTAPITGRYHLSFTVRLVDVDSASSYVIVRLQTSNRNIDPIHDADEFSSDQQYVTISLSMLVDMDANDTASLLYLQSAGSTQVDNDPSHTYFSGYLVA